MQMGQIVYSLRIKMYYNILSLIQIDATDKLWPEWSLFQCSAISNCDLQIDIVSHNQLKYGLEILGEQPGNAVLQYANCLLCVNSNWSKAKLTVFNSQTVGISKLLNALLFTHLSVKGTLEMHASLVERGGKGILFLGPSGIGKTTQAELWREYRGAEIINGDRVFLKQKARKFLGCGSPWHGSSSYCLNKQVPIYGIIILKQSINNLIRRLTGFEMISGLMNSVFLPSWYIEGYKAACDTLDALLRTVPVYELSCRPDEDAVRLTEETIFGKRMI